MASAREYSHLTSGVRRDVVAMIERAVAGKRKGEELVVHGSQCHGYIGREVTTVRETNFLDGEAQRSMTLVSSARHSGKVDMTLDVSLAGPAGQAASKAAKKWGSKASDDNAPPPPTRPRRRVSSRSLGAAGRGGGGEGGGTQVLDIERVLRARRDASVVVSVRERRDAELGRRESPRGRTSGVQLLGSKQSWSSVCLTAEEIFRECSGKWWLGEKEDAGYVYCTVKQSCNVDNDFSQFISAIQLHIHGVMKIQERIN